MLVATMGITVNVLNMFRFFSVVNDATLSAIMRLNQM
ncbi:hypothetical protein FHX16_002184 [Rhizobium sp. BK661]|nr:hypothetical protein [Rhizobium sp. BK661]